jgi:UrcA family protein
MKERRMRIRAPILAVAAIGATLATTATPALASNQRLSARIAYSDLNLNAAAGRAALQSRIEAAARRLCSQHVGQSLAEQNYRRACRSDAAGTAAELAADIAG